MTYLSWQNDLKTPDCLAACFLNRHNDRSPTLSQCLKSFTPPLHSWGRSWNRCSQSISHRLLTNQKWISSPLACTETLVRYHHTPTRMAATWKFSNNKNNWTYGASITPFSKWWYHFVKQRGESIVQENREVQILWPGRNTLRYMISANGLFL